jgi:hypothetical protein
MRRLLIATEEIIETFNPGARSISWARFTSSGEVRIVGKRKCVLVPVTVG